MTAALELSECYHLPTTVGARGCGSIRQCARKLAHIARAIAADFSVERRGVFMLNVGELMKYVVASLFGALMLIGFIALAGAGHGWMAGAASCLPLAPISFAA